MKKTAPQRASTSDLLRAALEYARAGWPVFALRANGREPLAGSRGFYDAAVDEGTIEHMFVDTRRNVGIRTGSGLLVLDADRKHDRDGAETVTQLEQRFGELPLTPEVETTTGGLHIYLRVTTEMRNTAGVLGRGLDTRGDGGYVVAPPSLIDGRRYRWRTGLSPDDVPVAVAPTWLLDLLRAPAREQQTVHDVTVSVTSRSAGRPTRTASWRYVAAAIEAECLAVATAPEGERNQTLNRAAYSLARFVADGLVGRAAVIDALEMAARYAKLQRREVRRTIDSAFRARGAA